LINNLAWLSVVKAAPESLHNGPPTSFAVATVNDATTDDLRSICMAVSLSTSAAEKIYLAQGYKI